MKLVCQVNIVSCFQLLIDKLADSTAPVRDSATEALGAIMRVGSPLLPSFISVSCHFSRGLERAALLNIAPLADSPALYTLDFIFSSFFSLLSSCLRDFNRKKMMIFFLKNLNFDSSFLQFEFVFDDNFFP